MTHLRLYARLLILIFLFAPLASFAGSFSGFYAVAGMALDAHVADDRSTDMLNGSLGATKSDLGQGKQGESVAVGYQFALSDRFVLMLEAGKDLGTDMSLSTKSALVGSLGFFSTVNREWQLNRDWYIALKPGLQINPSTLVYLSLAHHPGSAHLSSALHMDCLIVQACINDQQRSGSSSMQGTGIGAGMQTALSDQLFFRVEIEKIDFGGINMNSGNPVTSPNNFSIVSLKPSEYLGRISLGYHF